jgi:hypothetical protein
MHAIDAESKIKGKRCYSYAMEMILKLVLCDGARVCDRCQIDNALCDYSQEAGHQRSRTSS